MCCRRAHLETSGPNKRVSGDFVGGRFLGPFSAFLVLIFVLVFVFVLGAFVLGRITPVFALFVVDRRRGVETQLLLFTLQALFQQTRLKIEKAMEKEACSFVIWLFLDYSRARWFATVFLISSFSL